MKKIPDIVFWVLLAIPFVGVVLNSFRLGTSFSYADIVFPALSGDIGGAITSAFASIFSSLGFDSAFSGWLASFFAFMIVDLVISFIVWLLTYIFRVCSSFNKGGLAR